MVYVGVAGDSAIVRYRLDTSGSLIEEQRIGFPGVGGPGSSTPMAFSPDRSRLYVGYRGEQPQIVSFTRAGDSQLTAAGNAPIAAAPAYLSVVNGNVLGASYVGGVVTRNPISNDGIVGPTSQVLDVGPKAHAVVGHGAEILVASLGTDRVLRFGWNGNDLTPSGNPFLAATDSGPRHLVLGANGVVYVINELSATIDSFSAEGAILHSVPLRPNGERGSAADIHLTPDGKSLFASERRSGTLVGFDVAPDGRLTLASRIDTEREPRGFAIDPTGQWLIAAGTETNHLAIYRIEGAALIPAGRLATGANPNWIEIV